MAIILGGTQDPFLAPSTVTGPFSRTESYSTFFRKRDWYRQKPITDRPLQFDLDTYGELYDTQHSGNWSSWSYGFDANDSRCVRALAKARERFNAKIGSNAGLGIDLAEWKQSLSMVESRGLQLFKFVSALKRGRFSDAYSAIRGRVPREPPKGLHKGKGFANNFLEWHFGWAPLVNDIHDAIQVLQSPLSCKKVRARATIRDATKSSVRISNYVLNDSSDFKWTVELGAVIYITNPNLRLASQLGLVNPASLAWEVVPFSFVVDWFVPVGNFLSQYTDFVGLELNAARTTYTWYNLVKHSMDVDPPNGSYGNRRAKWRFTMKRALGIPSYRLVANQFTGLSAMRGLTAIALLLQQLRSK